MLGTLLALAAAAPTVIDAERAFAQMAQDKGQWTAFRAFAAPDAVMFTPQPVNAQEFLKPLKDPPKAVRWWPIKAWVSCDTTLAITSGGAVWPDGHYSQYLTVWRRQPDGSWKWVYDNGQDILEQLPAPVRPPVYQSICLPKNGPPPPPSIHDVFPPNRGGEVRSSDGTLSITWDAYANGRHFVAVDALGYGTPFEMDVVPPK